MSANVYRTLAGTAVAAILLAATAVTTLASGWVGTSLDDDFSDGVIDPVIWEAPSHSPRTHVFETYGRLEISHSANAQNDPGGNTWGAALDSRCELRGDFEIQVDFQLLDWPGGTPGTPGSPYGNGMRIALGTDAGWLERTSFSRNEIDENYYFGGDYGEIDIVDIPQIPGYHLIGGLKLERAGNRLTASYQDSPGGTWVDIATHYAPSDPTRFMLNTWSHDEYFADRFVRIAFDDLNVSADLITCDAGGVQPGNIVFARNGFTESVFYDNIPRPDGIVVKNNGQLLVVNELGPDGPFVLKARRGESYDTNDAITPLGHPFDNPDDMVKGDNRQLFVADGQGQTVFRVPSQGGSPVPFVTTATTGSPDFSPFGVTIAPSGFNGPNVDPGDLIVADNGDGQQNWAVWAVSQTTGQAKRIAQGNVFKGGPLLVDFDKNGTLYVFENPDPTGDGRVVTLDAFGNVSPVVNGIQQWQALAIHPVTGQVYYKQDVGVLFRVSRLTGQPELFATNIGDFQAMEFNQDGTALYISATDREQVIEISGSSTDWRRP